MRAFLLHGKTHNAENKLNHAEGSYMQQEKLNINLAGRYKLEDNLLVSENATLRLGLRHKPKRGQAKRFIGYIDTTKPDSEQYTYLSSLYSKQGTPKFTLDYAKQRYELNMTGINQVVIERVNSEPVLEYKPTTDALKGLRNE